MRPPARLVENGFAEKSMRTPKNITTVMSVAMMYGCRAM